MAERKLTAQAAGLQRKRKGGKIDKAHALTGMERIHFETRWTSLPESIRKKCTAAELAQLVRMLAENTEKMAEARTRPFTTIVNRARTDLVAFQNRSGREFSRLRAYGRGDIRQALQSALTSLAVRLRWVRK